MNEAGMLTDVLSQICEKGNDVMFNLGLDFQYPFHLKRTPLPHGLCGLRGNVTTLGKSFNRQSLNLLPNGETIFIGPDLPHGGAGVPLNHANFCSFEYSLASFRIFCMFALSLSKTKYMRLSTDLDQKDIELLRILQKEGRSSLNALAEAIGLSSPAVGERLRKLEERGTVRGFAALLAPSSLALDITAFIQVRVDSSTHYRTFLGRAMKHEEVMECHAITGDASHLLKIRTQNTSTLERLLGEIQKWPGVVGTRTNLVLSTHKETPELPLSHAQSVVREERTR
jgi:Lrp/AsnC family leucine-responsive transcriptional regulator